MRLGKYVLLLCLLLLPAGFVIAQSDADAITFGAGDVFRIRVPAGWTATSEDDVLVLRSAVDALEVQLYVTEGYADFLTEPLVDVAAAAWLAKVYTEIYRLPFDAATVDADEQRAALLYAPDNLSVVLKFAPSLYLMTETYSQGGALTDDQLAAVNALLDGITADVAVPPAETLPATATAPADATAAPTAAAVIAGACEIQTSQPNTVRMHTGPGLNRTVITFMPANTPLDVQNAERDRAGNLWYQVDPQQAAPGTAALELWIPAADVAGSGDCPAP